MRMTYYVENPLGSLICTCDVLRVIFLFLNYFKLLMVQWAKLRISSRVLCICFESLYRGGNHKLKCKFKEPYTTGKATYFRVCGDLESRTSDVISASLEAWHQGSTGLTVSDTRHQDLSVFHQVWEIQQSRGFRLIPSKSHQATSINVSTLVNF